MVSKWFPNHPISQDFHGDYIKRDITRGWWSLPLSIKVKGGQNPFWDAAIVFIVGNIHLKTI